MVAEIDQLEPNLLVALQKTLDTQPTGMRVRFTQERLHTLGIQDTEIADLERKGCLVSQWFLVCPVCHLLYEPKPLRAAPIASSLNDLITCPHAYAEEHEEGVEARPVSDFLESSYVVDDGLATGEALYRKVLDWASRSGKAEQNQVPSELTRWVKEHGGMVEGFVVHRGAEPLRVVLARIGFRLGILDLYFVWNSLLAREDTILILVSPYELDAQASSFRETHEIPLVSLSNWARRVEILGGIGPASTRRKSIFLELAKSGAKEFPSTSVDQWAAVLAEDPGLQVETDLLARADPSVVGKFGEDVYWKIFEDKVFKMLWTILPWRVVQWGHVRTGKPMPDGKVKPKEGVEVLYDCKTTRDIDGYAIDRDTERSIDEYVEFVQETIGFLDRPISAFMIVAPSFAKSTLDRLDDFRKRIGVTAICLLPCGILGRLYTTTFSWGREAAAGKRNPVNPGRLVADLLLNHGLVGENELARAFAKAEEEAKLAR